MSHELYGGEDQKPRLVMSQETFVATTNDWARERYNVTRYTFRREGAAEEGDPQVQVEARDTGADTAFITRGAERRNAAGETVSAGSGPGSELSSYEVVAKLNEQQTADVAERLADLMFFVSEMQI
jgi:hypothetical protein